jgi:hypothetical protein
LIDPEEIQPVAMACHSPQSPVSESLPDQQFDFQQVAGKLTFG